MPRSPLLVWQGPDDPRGVSLLFIRTWAEAVRRQVPIAREARSAHDRDMYASELGEDWSPDDHQIARGFRVLWAQESTLVWMAAQLDRWLQRYSRETGQTVSPEIGILRTLRNSLEHLDASEFEDGYAVPRGRFAYSIADLPESRLYLGTVTSTDLFGVVSYEEIGLVATAVLSQINDWYDVEPDFDDIDD